MFVNDGGVFVGSGAQISGSGVVLSAMNAPDDQLLAKAPTFTAGQHSGTVTVEPGAQVRASGGPVALLGPAGIRNEGDVRAPAGPVALISSSRVDAILGAASSFQPALTPGTAPAVDVANPGSIQARHVLLHADTSSTITSTGSLNSPVSRLEANQFRIGATTVGTIATTCSLAGGVLRAQAWRDGKPVVAGTRLSVGAGSLVFSRQQATAAAGFRTLRVNTLQADGPFDPESQYGALSCEAALFVPGRPRLTGEPRVGGVLVVNRGDWSPAPTAYRYRWFRDGVAIPQTNGPTRKLTAADAGHLISVEVTGTRLNFENAAQKSPARRVQRVLRRTPRPRIIGDAHRGKLLTAMHGRWRPDGVRFSYQWLRKGKPIPGATKRRYRTVAGDVGRKLAVVVTGSKAGYTSVSVSSSRFRIRR